MSGVDWTLIIGYQLNEALEYCAEEEVEAVIVRTAPPKKLDQLQKADQDDFRVIGVRQNTSTVELICTIEDWSIS